MTKRTLKIAKPPRDYATDGLAGCVSRHRVRQIGGGLVSIYHTAQSGMGDPESDGGPWLTLCEAHSCLAFHGSLNAARDWVSRPLTWCPGCQEAHKFLVTQTSMDGGEVTEAQVFARDEKDAVWVAVKSGQLRANEGWREHLTVEHVPGESLLS